jgi:hypothetical protein
MDQQLIITIILTILAYFLGRFRDDKQQLFNKKLEAYSAIVIEINSASYLHLENRLEYFKKLIALLAPARLIGSTKTVNELRSYFSLVGNYYDMRETEHKAEILKNIAKSAMELEQLMRKDLIGFRNLSHKNITIHNSKKI